MSNGFVYPTSFQLDETVKINTSEEFFGEIRSGLDRSKISLDFYREEKCIKILNMWIDNESAKDIERCSYFEDLEETRNMQEKLKIEREKVCRSSESFPRWAHVKNPIDGSTKKLDVLSFLRKSFALNGKSLITLYSDEYDTEFMQNLIKIPCRVVCYILEFFRFEDHYYTEPSLHCNPIRFIYGYFERDLLRHPMIIFRNIEIPVFYDTICLYIRSCNHLKFLRFRLRSKSVFREWNSSKLVKFESLELDVIGGKQLNELIYSTDRNNRLRNLKIRQLVTFGNSDILIYPFDSENLKTLSIPVYVDFIHSLAREHLKMSIEEGTSGGLTLNGNYSTKHEYIFGKKLEKLELNFITSTVCGECFNIFPFLNDVSFLKNLPSNLKILKLHFDYKEIVDDMGIYERNDIGYNLESEYEISFPREIGNHEISKRIFAFEFLKQLEKLEFLCIEAKLYSKDNKLKYPKYDIDISEMIPFLPKSLQKLRIVNIEVISNSFFDSTYQEESELNLHVELINSKLSDLSDLLSPHIRIRSLVMKEPYSEQLREYDGLMDYKHNTSIFGHGEKRFKKKRDEMMWKRNALVSLMKRKSYAALNKMSHCLEVLNISDMILEGVEFFNLLPNGLKYLVISNCRLERGSSIEKFSLDRLRELKSFLMNTVEVDSQLWNILSRLVPEHTFFCKKKMFIPFLRFEEEVNGLRMEFQCVEVMQKKDISFSVNYEVLEALSDFGYMSCCNMDSWGISMDLLRCLTENEIENENCGIYDFNRMTYSYQGSHATNQVDSIGFLPVPPESESISLLEPKILSSERRRMEAKRADRKRRKRERKKNRNRFRKDNKMKKGKWFKGR